MNSINVFCIPGFTKQIGLMLTFVFLFEMIQAQTPVSASQRKVIHIPDIPGYKTLKCDFHIHTVFSDGNVWPTVRVDEAWLEGLDAIAITDHIEYLPHKEDVKVDYNRSYDIASPRAKEKGILLVKAAEITRPMPPGHLNVLFIKDPNAFDKDKDVIDVLKEARKQGAFIFWDHPGWEPMAPDGIKWYKEHTWLLENDLLDGIEVYNNLTYYPEAFGWAMEKGLTMLCNTDVHEPIGMNFDIANSHRPMALVFAEDKTEGALKEALLAKRSVAYFDNTVIGSAKFLTPLFHNSIEIEKNKLNENEHLFSFLIKNNSDFDFELELSRKDTKGPVFPEKITVLAHHSTIVEVSGGTGEFASNEEMRANYKVGNFFTLPGKNLEVTLDLTGIE